MKVTLNSLGWGLAALAVTLTFSQCGAPAEGSTTDATADSGEARLTRVGVRTVNAAPFSHAFAVQGNVETDRIANVLAEFPGVVAEVLVEEGAKVSEGQALVRVNTDVLAKQRAELVTQLEFGADLVRAPRAFVEQGDWLGSGLPPSQNRGGGPEPQPGHP